VFPRRAGRVRLHHSGMTVCVFWQACTIEQHRAEAYYVLGSSTHILRYGKVSS
jgi:hypothetical protein